MILITGASGMIGQALVEHYLKQGIPLRVQVRNRPAFLSALTHQSNSLEVRRVDFSKASTKDFCSLVEGCSEIIHTAGLVHQPQAEFNEYELLNVRTTQQLAESGSQAGADTFLFLSTIAIYGSGTLSGIDETAPPKPISPYAVSKHKSETWLESFPSYRRKIIVRPALVFGEGDRGNMLKLIKQIKSGRYFHISPNHALKSLIYSKDLAQAISLCLEKVPSGFHVFNAANPEPVSVRQLADQIAHCTKRSIPSLPSWLLNVIAGSAEAILKNKSPLTKDQIEKLSSTTTVSTHKMSSQTGFIPQFSLAQALQAEIAWAEASGAV